VAEWRGGTALRKTASTLSPGNRRLIRSRARRWPIAGGAPYSHTDSFVIFVPDSDTSTIKPPVVST
jgi:hypothetical protein